MPRALLALRVDDSGVFDASSAGLQLKTAGSAVAATPGGGATFAKSSRVTVTPTAQFDKLSAFTLTMQATPAALAADQVLLDSQRPPVRLTLRAGGTVLAEVQSEKGWEQVPSSAKLVAGKSSEIRLVRAAGGQLTLEIDGKGAGALKGGARLGAAGRQGMTIGADLSGKRGFEGVLGAVELLPAAITAADLRKQAEHVKTTVADLSIRYKAAIRYVPRAASSTTASTRSRESCTRPACRTCRSCRSSRSRNRRRSWPTRSSRPRAG